MVHPGNIPAEMPPEVSDCIRGVAEKGNDFPLWCLKQIAFWKKRAIELRPQTEEWRRTLPPSAKLVLPPNFHMALFQEMCKAAKHEDTALAAR